MRSLPYGLLALTLCVGCTSLLPGDEPSADAGSPVDAGPRADAGPRESDAGLDAGPDAGSERDGGMDVDGGSPSDAGRELDAGPDAGRDAGCPSVPSVTFDHVAAGGSGSCAWNRTDLYCWGDNGSGQIALPVPGMPLPPTSYDSAERVAAAADIQDVCIGERFICWATGQVLTCRGVVSGDEASEITRTHGEVITQLSCGAEHVCFVDADEELHCIGENVVGQSTGVATTTAVDFPGHVVGEVMSVSAGDEHTCYAREMMDPGGAREVETFCFGDSRGFDPTGKTEIVPTETPHTPPDRDSVSGPRDVCYLSPVADPTQIGCSFLAPSTFATVNGLSVGLEFYCAIAAVGANAPAEVHCTGSNDDGRLGRTPGATVTPPWPRPVCEEYREIRSGARHSCVLTNAQRVLCFGRNDVGQLGRTTPVNWGPMAPINL